ncbi:MAG: shikimate kinase [Streptomycetales bacterium]
MEIPEARVLLVGMMGVGKTTVGRALADLTGWPYVDNDQLVARVAGAETREVLDTRGVQALREAESGALTHALREPLPVIASIAGGIVESAQDRSRLRDGGFVVWLRARVDTLVERVGTGSGRPWLQPEPETALRRLYVGREALYEEVAALVLDVDDAAPEVTARRILARLRERRSPEAAT